MKFGLLHIRYPKGQTADFSLDQPTIIIGRAQGNDLVLDDVSVSRRHVHLRIESGRVMVEDTGSANGTFIGSQRLEAGVPALLGDNDVLRVGDVEVRFTPPPPVQVDQSLAPTPVAQAEINRAKASPVSPTPIPKTPPGRPVNCSLAGPAQPVSPGSTVSATLTIQNRGTVVDEMTIRVSGVPDDWVRLNRQKVPLLPNAQEQVTITFQPPKKPESKAGEYSFNVTVLSKETRSGENVRGLLRVLPFQNFTMELQPVRSPRNFQLIARNLGNIPVSYQLNGVDEEGALNYYFGLPTISLRPGEVQSIALQVQTKTAPRLGARETRMFSVVANPLAGEQESKTGGQFLIRSRIPVWLIPIIVLVALCLCISSAYAYITFCPTYGPNLPLCPADARPKINAFLANATEVPPGTDVIIGWDVSQADKVELVSPLQETLDSKGTKSYKIDQTTTFTIRAQNFAGQIEKSFVVRVTGVAPTIQSFTSTPGRVITGLTDKIVLSWVVIGATSISIQGVDAQNLPPTGTKTISPAPNTTTTYTLVAINDAGTVQEQLQVEVGSAGCYVTNIAVNKFLNVLDGPDPSHHTVVQLKNGTQVQPVGRNTSASWLLIQAQNKEGWADANFITCSPENILDYPTIAPGDIPTPIPSATPTYTPTYTPTPTFTATFTPTDTPTITETPKLYIIATRQFIYVHPILIDTYTPTP